MAKGFGKCLQCILVVISILILVCGVVITGLSIYTRKDGFLSFSGTLNTADFIAIGAGVFLILLSVLGCCGALKESKCMLITFFLILLVIFIVLLTIAVLIFVFKEKFESEARQALVKSVPKYGYDDSETQSWDYLQEQLTCCGLSEGYNHSYTIWTQSKYLQNLSKAVPDSCCKGESAAEIENCQSDPERYAYSDDCVHKIKEWFDDNKLSLGGACIGVVCVLAIGLCLSCALCMTMSGKEKQPRDRPLRRPPNQP